MGAEQKDHNYSTFKDTYLKYRKVVAEWMLDVCEHFTLHPTTTHAAICYLDRLQPHEKFSRFEWQMIAISCILMASKYNECEDHVPDLATLEDITQQAISNETVLQYELWALKRMGWKLNARTAICFVCSYLRCGIILESDIMRASVGEEGKSSIAGPTSPSQSVFVSETNPEVLAFLDAKAGKLSKKIAAACILDSSYKQFLASDVAIAIVYVIRSQLVVEPWAPELSRMGLPEDPLDIESVRQIVSMITEAEGGVASGDSNRPFIQVPPRAGNAKGKELSNDSPTGVEDTGKINGASEPVEDKYSHVTSIGSDATSVSPGSKENRRPAVNSL